MSFNNPLKPEYLAALDHADKQILMPQRKAEQISVIRNSFLAGVQYQKDNSEQFTEAELSVLSKIMTAIKKENIHETLIEIIFHGEGGGFIYDLEEKLKGKLGEIQN